MSDEPETFDPELEEIADAILAALKKRKKVDAAFNPDQPRDERGRWGSGGSGPSLSQPSSDGAAEEALRQQNKKLNEALRIADQLIAEKERQKTLERFKVSDLLKDHPTLEKHPWLKDMEVVVDPAGLKKGDAGGMYHPSYGTTPGRIILPDTESPNARIVLLHELDHARQQAEGIQGGGSPEMMMNSEHREETMKLADKLYEQYLKNHESWKPISLQAWHERNGQGDINNPELSREPYKDYKRKATQEYKKVIQPLREWALNNAKMQRLQDLPGERMSREAEKWEPPKKVASSDAGRSRTYRKDYADPHEKLKEALAALLLVALVEKRKLLLAYVADYGTAGLLDYADTILDAGWDVHFTEAASILSAAAVDSTLGVMEASGIKYTETFVANLERHNDLIAKNEAARLLGLTYDVAHDVAVPTVAGFTPAEPALKQLSDVIEQTEQRTELIQQQQESLAIAPIDQAIDDLSLFSGERAAQMAHNAITFVTGASARASAAALGATLKRSETVGDAKVCKECAENEADGWIGINDVFSGSETMETPHHPNCRCGVEYEWQENMRVPAPELEEAA